MKVDIDTIKLKKKMTWKELEDTFVVLDNDPKFQKAIREFIRLTTS